MKEHPILRSKKNKIEPLRIELTQIFSIVSLKSIFKLLLLLLPFTATAIQETSNSSFSNIDSKFEKSDPQQRRSSLNDAYSTELVQISHPGADLTLHGSLTIPKNKKQFPAVLLLSDNGPQERNGDLHGLGLFDLMADFLGKNGIAVLRYDKRGVGSSTGSFENATLQDFGNDAIVALQWLKKRLGSNSNRIGILGHGEGTYVASLSCKSGIHPDFMIWMGGSSLRGDKALLEQNKKLLIAAGIQDSTVNKFVDLVHIFSQIIRFEKDNHQALDQINHSIKNQSIVFTAHEKTILPLSKLDLMALATQMTSPWLRSYLSFNPLKYMQECHVPLLALYAEMDHETPLKPNIEMLREFATESQNDRIVIKELAGHNHLFQKCSSGNIEEYKKLESGISQDALNILSNWIKSQ